MANSSILNNIIFKRSRCLNAISESDSKSKEKFYAIQERIKKNAILEGGEVSPSIKNSLNYFIESLSNVKNASEYYGYPLYLVQEFNNFDKNISNNLVENYINKVVPYVSNLSYINEAIERYNLTDEQVKKISESVENYMIADRILKNHESISKRFNIEAEAVKVNSKGLKDVVDSCCEMIDTYSLDSYKKMNICIEELNYLFEKNNCEYNKKDLVNYVTEYFLLSSSFISSKDLNGYRKVLEMNCYLESEDLDKVNYLFNPSESRSVRSIINHFLVQQEKTMQSLEDHICEIANKCTIEDIKYNIDKVFWLIWNVYKSQIFDQKTFESAILIWFDLFIARISDEISYLDNDDPIITKNDIDYMIDHLNTFDSIIIPRSTDNAEKIESIVKYKGYIHIFCEKLRNISEIIYPSSNIEAMKFVNQENTELIPLKEFKIFKFHNLIRAATNLDKYLKEKEKNIYKKGSRKIRRVVSKVKDVLFGESNIYSYIGEDNKADICVAQYYVDESNIEEMHEFLSKACNINNSSLESARCYYIINPGIAEIHVKESTTIQLDEKEISELENSIDESMNVYIEEFIGTVECLDFYDKLDNKSDIKHVFLEFANNPDFSITHLQVALEALSLLEVDKSDINLFCEKFNSFRKNSVLLNESNNTDNLVFESRLVDSLADKWVHEENVPLRIQLEAYQALVAVLEAGPDVKKPEIKKPQINIPSVGNKDDKSKNNKFSGVNLNSIKLYLEGLKTKMKDMSQKEKEVSKNLDNAFSMFAKNLQKAMISDRREAIIKGSVIPSFSRCVKIAIGLAGLGLVTGNPLVPIITAIGGFAVSKNLTKKERVLLLDEIETELEVIDKEISIAESKNQMKKYRALLKYKKDLQRQYQRIRYNIRVGKDILPGSASGIKNSNND